MRDACNEFTQRKGDCIFFVGGLQFVRNLTSCRRQRKVIVDTLTTIKFDANLYGCSLYIKCVIDMGFRQSPYFLVPIDLLDKSYTSFVDGPWQHPLQQLNRYSLSVHLCPFIHTNKQTSMLAYMCSRLISSVPQKKVVKLPPLQMRCYCPVYPFCYLLLLHLSVKYTRTDACTLHSAHGLVIPINSLALR